MIDWLETESPTFFSIPFASIRAVAIGGFRPGTEILSEGLGDGISLVFSKKRDGP